GVLLWEAVTGLRFWRDWHQVAIYRRLRSRTLPLQAAWIPIASDELFAIATRAIAANPDERYESAATMQAGIDEILAHPENDAPRSLIRSYMHEAFTEERARVDPAATRQGAATEQEERLRPPSIEIVELADGDVKLLESDVELVDSSPGWTTSP